MIGTTGPRNRTPWLLSRIPKYSRPEGEGPVEQMDTRYCVSPLSMVSVFRGGNLGKQDGAGTRVQYKSIWFLEGLDSSSL